MRQPHSRLDALRTLRAYLTTQINTTAHKVWVAYYLIRYAASGVTFAAAQALLLRAACHDLSKYRRDEARAFVRLAKLLTPAPAGTPAHDAVLAAFDRQVELHYGRNRHHPEHHDRGYAGMSELDRIEMIADWAAAGRRRPDGDLLRSIVDNAARYGYGEHESAWLRGIAARMGALGSP